MNILVPTDFSKFADYAFDVACQIAKITKSHIHVYHSADIPDDWEDLDVDTKARDTANKYIALEARDRMIKMKDQAVAMGITCDIHYTGGMYIKNIHEVLDKIKIDLIIMGSHGASGKEEWFIGSNSQKVIRKFHYNTLIVKNPAPSFSIDHVVFVTGLNQEDKEAFRAFLNFTSVFNPKEVHVLSIDTSAWFTQPTIVMYEALKDFKEIAKDYNCNTHFYKDHSIQSGIRNFISENNIDLVGISYKSRNPIKRLFLGSNVEMLINHSEKPVLCINS